MLYGNIELAELAAKKVSELDPGESGQVLLLSNVYASVGRFQDAEALRSGLQKKWIIKIPGLALSIAHHVTSVDYSIFLY